MTMAVIYATIAIASMMLSTLEFLSSKESTPPFFALGLLACAAWPLSFPLILIAARSQPVPVATLPARG